MPVKIFFCYAHEDELLLNKLKTQLKPLYRQGLVDLWHDRDINAGTEWEQEIDKHLNTAQIILLLVSPDFIDSDYCYGVEMQRAIERHNSGEVHVIPIILRHVHWLKTPLCKLQALPADGKPVKSWQDLDEAFFKVVEGITKVVEELNISTPDTTSVTPKEEPQPTPLALLEALRQTNPTSELDKPHNAKTIDVDKPQITSEKCSLAGADFLDDAAKSHIANIISDRQNQVDIILRQKKQKTLINNEITANLVKISEHQDNAENLLLEFRSLVHIYRSKHQIENALSVLNKMVHIAPLDPYAHIELANIYIDCGLLDEGIEELNFLSDIYLHSNQKEQASKTLLYISNIYSQVGENEKAYLKLLRALDFVSVDMVLLREAIIILLKLSFIQEAEKYQALIAHHYFERHQIPDRDYNENHGVLKLVEALQQLIVIDSYNFEAYDMLGQVYQSIGEHEQAFIVYKMLKKINPESSVAHARLTTLQQLREMNRK